jgi:hypothetical protein
MEPQEFWDLIHALAKTESIKQKTALMTGQDAQKLHIDAILSFATIIHTEAERLSASGIKSERVSTSSLLYPGKNLSTLQKAN